MRGRCAKKQKIIHICAMNDVYRHIDEESPLFTYAGGVLKLCNNSPKDLVTARIDELSRKVPHMTVEGLELLDHRGPIIACLFLNGQVTVEEARSNCMDFLGRNYKENAFLKAFEEVVKDLT